MGAELIAKQHRGDMNITFSDPEDIKTPEEELENVIDSEQLTPTTPSALQLQLGEWLLFMLEFVYIKNLSFIPISYRVS